MKLVGNAATMIQIEAITYTQKSMLVYAIPVCRATVKPLYYGHHWDHMKCPDWQGVRISEVVLYTSLGSRDNRQCPD